MVLKNHEVSGFASFLVQLKLEGKQSRMRTRLFKILTERLEVIEEERFQIIDKYSEKDEEESPIVVKNNDGSMSYKMSDTEAFTNEYTSYMNEECIIENNLERKDMLEAVKDAVLNTTIEFSGQDAFEYDRYCEIVETITY